MRIQARNEAAGASVETFLAPKVKKTSLRKLIVPKGKGHHRFKSEKKKLDSDLNVISSRLPSVFDDILDFASLSGYGDRKPKIPSSVAGSRRKSSQSKEGIERRIERVIPSEWRVDALKNVKNVLPADEEQLRLVSFHIQHQVSNLKLKSSVEGPLANYYRLKRKLEYCYQYKHLSFGEKLDKINETFMGIVISKPYRLERIYCEYTQRSLPPVIYQTCDIKSAYLSIREAIIKQANGQKLSKNQLKNHPVTFAYITSDHIDAISALLNRYFWSGIDIRLTLTYPEFTCVALYRKVVIGFGIMAPGSHLNEGYINFIFVRPLWTNCGIGKFILYHLTQVARSWTTTLHVSPSNPAMLLYQKFGFKCQKMVLNFYTHFHIMNFNYSRHAVFMKLSPTV